MARIDPETLNLQERVVRTNRVQKTHKGGRTMSWNALVVVGDGQGHVGAGLGKARAIPDAIRKGVEDAKKRLIEVPIVGTSIPHQVVTSFGASTVILKPAAPGTGVVAGTSMRVILEAAGIKDVLGKCLGSRNPINVAWATMKALQMLKRADQVAQMRGKRPEEVVPWMRKYLEGKEEELPMALKITLVRSPIGYSKRQKRTVEALGLRRLHHSVVKPDNPAIRGMVRKISHLVIVEEVADEPAAHEATAEEATTHVSA